MKKSFITILLIIFTGLMWIMTITNKEEDDTGAYIQSLKTMAEQNEAEGLYKPNESIYLELISYEDDIQWYRKLKDTYNKLEKSDLYWDMCRTIFERFPEDEENTLELIRNYDANNSTSTIIDLYNYSLSEEWKNNEEVKDIYMKHACKHQYETTEFDGWEKSWGSYMLVKEADKYRYVYASGEYAFSNSFDEADLFIDDYAAVKSGGEWFFIDKEGDKYLNCSQTYEEVHSYSEGYAVVVKDGKYGYIDYEGNEYSVGYDYASAMYNGVVAVKDGNNWYILGSNLEKLNDEVYEDVIVNSMGICSRSGLMFVKENGKYKVIDLQGNAVTEAVFEEAKLYAQDGIAAVKKDGKWGFIDMEGNVVIDYQYEDADSFSNGFAPVKTDGSYEYIYRDGVVRTDLNLLSATQLRSNGYGVVSTEDGYRVITFKMCHIGE